MGTNQARHVIVGWLREYKGICVTYGQTSKEDTNHTQLRTNSM
jgi:hypothetical protein